MATVIYQCPPTMSLHIINGAVFARIRPLEYFAIDGAVQAQIDDIEAQGFDTGDPDFEPDPQTAYLWSNPNHPHAHNAYGLADPV